jgi:hypothetical protein
MYPQLRYAAPQPERLALTDLSHPTDSGGPGTYSQLLILKEYMDRLANDLGVGEEEVYPADHFDLMGGVGFGGWVPLSFNPKVLPAAVVCPRLCWGT